MIRKKWAAKKKSIVFAAVLIAAMAGAYISQAVLYMHQALAVPESGSKYYSDLCFYMSWIREGKHIYSLAENTMGLAYRFGGELCVGILLALFAMLSLYAAYRALRLCADGEKNSFLLFFAAFISQMAFTAYVPGRCFYQKLNLTVNTFHNPTYIQMEPLALFAMAALFAIFPRLRERPDAKTLVVFALCCTLATWVKPSFLFCMAPALLLYLIVDFVLTKCKNLKNEVLVGICVLPGVAVALYQSTMLFDENSTIVFAPVWNLRMIGRSFLEGGLRAGVFALAVLVLYGGRYIKKHWFSFSYLVCAVGLGEYLCLVETGERASDGNLAWSAQIGLYAALLAGIGVLIKEKEERKTPRWIFCAVLLFWQLLSGVYYYIRLLAGESYWI